MRLLLTEGGKLSDLIIKNGIKPDMPCGGSGNCGKCRVRFISEAPAASDADRKFLSEEQIKEGWRLSCRTFVEGETEIELPDELIDNCGNSQIMTIGDIREKDENNKAEVTDNGDRNLTDDDRNKTEFGIAVDIGTTTIVAGLVNLKDGVVRKTATMNSGSVFGADVISRIKAANEGMAAELQRQLLEDIRGLLDELISGEYSMIPGSDVGGVLEISKLTIAGNTTMLHLLMGDSCEGLGRAPYKPTRLEYPVMNADEVLKGIQGTVSVAGCSIMPGISAFVGGDIVSGMYELSFDKIPEGKRYMLIDLGTNGEMAVADSERITVCSTAAGPVFEGGGISCGMAGVAGAIEHVSINIDNKAAGGETITDIKVIGDGNPIGICGSGVLEMVSELRRTEIIDDTGLYSDEYFDEGYPVFSDGDKTISFTQDDIRQVQLAKAAIRSGIDTLLDAAGLIATDIDKVYLAGGFSEHLDIEKIKYLKILPEEFLVTGVAQCVGNTSLSGCIKALMSDSADEELSTIIKKATELTLANTDTFGDSFIEAMNF